MAEKTGIVVSSSAQCIQDDMDRVCDVFERAEKCIRHFSQKNMEESDHFGDLDTDELCSMLVYLPIDLSSVSF
jgi:hypothetical protein